MKVHGNIDLNLNMLTKFAVDVVDELPNNPVVGRLVFKQDVGLLFICTQTLPSVLWVPLATKSLTYVHEQVTVSNEWVVTHEMDTTDIFVQVYTPSGYAIIPDEIIILNSNQIKILFSQNMAGKVIVAALNDVTKMQKTSLEYVFSKTSSVTINHGFGYYPHVSIINKDGEVVIPNKITHIDKNSLTVNFGDLQIEGTAIIS